MDRSLPIRTLNASDGVELAVHDLGGEGPPLLVVHATGFPGLAYAPFVDRLGDDFHAWVPDLRGHGDATAPHGLDLTWEAFTDDLLAVIDGLELPPAFGFGHSMGGAILLLAELRRPGLFRALYCYEPIVIPPGLVEMRPRPLPIAEAARRRRDVFPSRDEAYATYASKPPLAALHPEALRAYVEHGFADTPEGEVRLKCEREHEARIFEMSSGHDAFERLEELDLPVTIACGAIELGQPSMFAPHVAGRLRQVSEERFPELGHFGPLEDPDTVAKSVRRAFRR